MHAMIQTLLLGLEQTSLENKVLYAGNDYGCISTLVDYVVEHNGRLDVMTNHFFEQSFYVGYEKYIRVLSSKEVTEDAYNLILFDGIDVGHDVAGFGALQAFSKSVHLHSQGVLIFHNQGIQLPSVKESMNNIITEILSRSKISIQEESIFWNRVNGETVYAGDAATGLMQWVKEHMVQLYEASQYSMVAAQRYEMFLWHERERRYRSKYRKVVKAKVEAEWEENEAKDDTELNVASKGGCLNKIKALFFGHAQDEKEQQQIEESSQFDDTEERTAKYGIVIQKNAPKKHLSDSVDRNKRLDQVLVDLQAEKDQYFSLYYNYSMFIRNLVYPLTEAEQYVANEMEQKRQQLLEECATTNQSDVECEMPEVTILLNVTQCNAALFRTIQSIAMQTYVNWKCIICCTEKVKEVLLQELEAKAIEGFDLSRVSYVICEEETCEASRYNKMLTECQNGYIAFAVAGCSWDKEYLLLLTHIMETEKAYGAVYSAVRVNNMKEKSVIKIHFSAYTMACMENRNEIFLGAFLCRADWIAQYGGMNEDLPLKLWADDFILRFGRLAPIYSLPCILCDSPNKVFGSFRSMYEYRLKQEKEAVVTPDTVLTQKMNEFDDRFAQENEREQLVQEHLAAKKLLLSSIPGVDIQGYSLYHYCQKREYPKTPRKVAIIIPSYDALECLQVCMEAIEAYTPEYMDYEVILVDNCSSAMTVSYLKWLEANKSYVKVIYNDHNMGYTYAVNQGMEAARKGSDMVLLNNDAFVTENWLDALYEVKDKVKDAGLIVPRQQLLPHRITITKDVPGCDVYRETDVNLSFRHRNVVSVSKYAKEQFVQLNFAAFFLVMITDWCYDRLGQMDVEQGRHYDSDTIYCQKAAEHGIEMVYTPFSKVYHLWRRSTRQLKEQDEELFQIIVRNNDWNDLEDNEVTKN